MKRFIFKNISGISIIISNSKYGLYIDHKKRIKNVFPSIGHSIFTICLNDRKLRFIVYKRKMLWGPFLSIYDNKRLFYTNKPNEKVKWQEKYNDLKGQNKVEINEIILSNVTENVISEIVDKII